MFRFEATTAAVFGLFLLLALIFAARFGASVDGALERSSADSEPADSAPGEGGNHDHNGGGGGGEEVASEDFGGADLRDLFAAAGDDDDPQHQEQQQQEAEVVSQRYGAKLHTNKFLKSLTQFEWDYSGEKQKQEIP
jgi:hypothetical protein